VRGSRVLVIGAVLACAILAAAIGSYVERSHAVAAQRDARARGRETRERAQRDDASDVAGFTGEIEAARGAHLGVRLARLHAGARQQRFDADALARRFGLGEGEPFVCEITVRGAGVVEAGALRSISVRDDRGLAQAPFPAPSASRSEPVDPLSTLLAPPSEALQPGSAVSVILWGREPGSGARLAGLDAGDIVLAPAPLASRDLDAALARIDARAPAGGPK
jgi:hypothetical protein